MTTSYSSRSNPITAGVMFLYLIVGLAIASPVLTAFSIGIYSGASRTISLLTYPENYTPIPMPSQLVSESAARPHFTPTSSDCPPSGECPRVRVAVRKEDYTAFTRHLELAALNHGGAYAYSRLDEGLLFRSSVDAYTIRLPKNAADELRLLHINGFASFHRAPVSPGYQQWATRWSDKRETASPDFVTLQVRVSDVSKSNYYFGPVFLLIGLSGVCFSFFILVSFRPRQR